MADRTLSRSLCLAGLRGDRRLGLDAHAPEEGLLPSPTDRVLQAVDRRVNHAALALFPGGIRVEASALDHAVAVEQTRVLMSRSFVTAVFEAAFEVDGVRIRVDILERLAGGRWGVREVEPSTSVERARHLPDLAIQVRVLERCGVDVGSAEILHVNGDYVRAPGGVDWRTYFRRVELIEELEARGHESTAGEAQADQEGTLESARGEGTRDIAARLDELAHTLARTTPPEPEVGAFCQKPPPGRDRPLRHDERATPRHLEPSGESPTPDPSRMEGEPSEPSRVSREFEGELGRIGLPVWTLVFEAISPAIPRFLGTRPYQPIVFQGSLHRCGEGGEVEHFEFLADGDSDPRPAVVSWLVDVLERDAAPVLVYSASDSRCLREMAACVSEKRRSLDSIHARLVDLLPIVREHVSHPGFCGSVSIERVAPILTPSVSDEDLHEIADGPGAMAAFERIMSGIMAPDEELATRRALLAYGRRETRALLELYRALRATVGLRRSL